MPRQNDSQRAARDYMQSHPGTTYRQALAIVTGKTPQPVPAAIQGAALEGFAEGWSNADLNALIATVGELVREGAFEGFDDILSSRQIEVAQKAHDLWVAEQGFGQDDDDDNPFTGRACEVDDCDRDARGCFCGAAHCDIHPHVSDDVEDTSWDGPRVEVAGRLSARSLNAALYGGWEIESITENTDEGTLSAVIRCPASMADSGFGLIPQSDRIRSFGGVRVTELHEYTVHLSLDHAEATGVGGVVVTASSLDAACEQADAQYGDAVVLVEGPDGTREML